jgi:FkbM family methyltransferase
VKIKGLAAAVGNRLRQRGLALLGSPRPYYFLPSPSVESQVIRFRFRGKAFVVEAGHSTPLYETIAEVVDFDCYQLEHLGADALSDGVIVDVGANVGVAALCLSQLSDLGIVCFEPLPENAARLRANLAANGVTRATVVESAITTINGKVSFWVPEHEDVGGRVSEVPLDAGGRFLEVNSVDLGAALSKVDGPIALVKVDCEGGEYDLLAQLTPAIVQRISALTFEIHERGEGRNLTAATRRLEELGYSLSFRPDPFGREQLHHVLARR